MLLRTVLWLLQVSKCGSREQAWGVSKNVNIHWPWWHSPTNVHFLVLFCNISAPSQYRHKFLRVSHSPVSQDWCLLQYLYCKTLDRFCMLKSSRSFSHLCSTHYCVHIMGQYSMVDRGWNLKSIWLHWINSQVRDLELLTQRLSASISASMKFLKYLIYGIHSADNRIRLKYHLDIGITGSVK